MLFLPRISRMGGKVRLPGAERLGVLPRDYFLGDFTRSARASLGNHLFEPASKFGPWAKFSKIRMWRSAKKRDSGAKSRISPKKWVARQDAEPFRTWTVHFATPFWRRNGQSSDDEVV